MQLKSPYINPEHKKALEALERYLSDIAGEPVEAVEVGSEEEIFKREGEYTFKFLLSEQGEIIGLKIHDFGKKLTQIPETILQFSESLLYLNLSVNQISNISPLEKLTNLTKLDLGGNKISDIRPLEKLTKLSALGLGSNNIDNKKLKIILQTLHKLPNLTLLDLESNQISDIRPLEKLTTLTTLYLIENQISDISPLGKLTNLTNLNLGFNQISDISPLEKLTNLTLLDLSINQISDISQLEKLTQLTELKLYNNQISDISPLEKLTTLTTLYLIENQISDISPLENLTKLTELYLSRNKISDISQLEKLTKLTVLDLEDNQISDISPLEKLTKLTVLNLGWNKKISDISPLEKLTKLRGLYLSGNQISDISPLGKLTNLTNLNLGFNQISDISPLGKLTNLTNLNLGFNQISDISPLGKLTKLTEVKLRNNQIKRLPEWIVDREWFYPSDLEGNPLEAPPWEVVKQGREAVERWFEIDKMYGFEKFSYAKILIVGPGEAGKTSLLKKLQNPEFKPAPNLLETTHGINVDFKEYDINKKELKKIYLNLWDFGGQHIQASLHHYFLSPDALYILVSPARKDDYQLSYWFRVIDHFGGEKPKVLVLFNQKSPNDIIDADNVLKRYKDTYKHFDIEYIVLDLKVDPDDDDWQIFQLKLRKKILSLPTLGKLGLKPWMQVMERLAKLPDNYITKQEFERIFKEFAPDLDKEYTDDLLLYLNAIGYLIAYPKATERLLRNFVFIKPSWLIEALYMPLKLYKDYARKRGGILEIDLLEQKWQELDYSDQEIALFVDLIQDRYFDIAFKLKDKDFLFPAFIPKEVPDFDWQAIEKPEQIMVLDFGNFLPESLITRFSVRYHSLIAKDQNGKLLVANKAVILQYPDGSLAYVVASLEENKIIVKVKTSGEDKRSDIRNKFLELYQELPHSKIFKTKLPCVCDQCQDNLKKGIYDQEKIDYWEFDDVINSIKQGDFQDKCRKSRQKIDLLKLVYGFELPKEVEKIVEQYIHIGDNYTNSKVNKTNVNGNDNTAVVGNEVGGSISITTELPAEIEDELSKRALREIQETLEAFREETAINLQELAEHFVNLAFEHQDELLAEFSDLKNLFTDLQSKPTGAKLSIGLSLVKLMQMSGILPPGTSEVLDALNISLSGSTSAKLKNLLGKKR